MTIEEFNWKCIKTDDHNLNTCYHHIIQERPVFLCWRAFRNFINTSILNGKQSSLTWLLETWFDAPPPRLVNDDAF